MNAPIRIGIVDSGCPARAAQVRAAVAFVIEGEQVRQRPAEPDRLGHGSRILEIIAGGAPEAEFYIAQVFRERLGTTPGQVAAAIDWLVAQQVQLINLSLGLRAPREVMAAACRRALDAGVILCASAAARGEPVYPAAFPGVLRMTGDARCAPDEISALATEGADYGGHVRPRDGALAGSGASMGCAHMSAHVARYLAQGGPTAPAAVRRWLDEQARYHGAERRRG